MFTTLRKADAVRKETDNIRYLLERIEKSGIPSMISEASNRGEYEIKVEYGSPNFNWDRKFTERVANTFADLGYKVENPSTLAVMTISWAHESGPVDDEEFT